MPNKIKIKRSYTANAVPLAADLETHEVAINYADNKLFVKDASGAIRTITLSGGGGSGSLSGSVTIPGSGDQYWADTLLLIKGDGNLADSSSYGRAVTAYGNAAATTATSKYGTGCLTFDGASGSYMALPQSSNWALTGSWTIEGWAYVAQSKTQGWLTTMTADAAAGDDGSLIIAPEGCWIFARDFASNNQLSWTFPSNAWAHFAFVSDSGTLRAYVNGVQASSVTQTIAITSQKLWLGSRFYDLQQYNFNGKLDDIRITKACRYPNGTTFTPPTSTYVTGPYVAPQTLPVTITGSGGGGSGLSWSSVPASTNATGTAGQIAYDDAAGFFYVATAANTWKRAALTTWFTASAVPGLVAWFDAADVSTLYDSTSGGSLVAANGAVARWADKSGAGNNALQATSGSRPTRRTSGLNGMPSVRFVADTGDDGDWLGIAHSSALNGPQGLAIFMVAATSQVGNNRALMGKWNAPSESTGNSWVFSYTLSGSLQAPTHLTNNGTDSFLATGTSSFNDGAKRLIGMISTSNSLVVRMNGIVQTTNSSAQLPDQNGTSGVVIGGYCGYSVASGQRLMSCDISEIMIYNATLSSQNIAAIESYLMSKWGIA